MVASNELFSTSKKSHIIIFQANIQIDAFYEAQKNEEIENELLGLGVIEFITKSARSRNTSGKEFFFNYDEGVSSKGETTLNIKAVRILKEKEFDAYCVKENR